jgi:structural maintenance of chromosome 2
LNFFIKLLIFYLNTINRFPQLNLEYKDPEQNFNRSRVKGLVCNLFEIKDPKFSNALEIAAGGKVFISL